MQNEIVQGGPLLDSKGALIQKGYSKKMLLDYDRRSIRANSMRIKEWDYYLVYNQTHALALTIADNSYMGLDSVTLIDFTQPWQRTTSPMRLFPMGKTNLPSSSSIGDTRINGKNYTIWFKNNGKSRRIICHMDDFINGNPIDADISILDEPEESMVIATPFKNRKKAFYYTHKINCMRAHGIVRFEKKEYIFKPENSFATLDWGRGVWTYKNTWYWGSASGLVDGEPFGFNIGYGFGDTSNASENMLFYKGKAHKLSKVTFNIPKKGLKTKYMDHWTFTSDDGRFEMSFEPIIDRFANTNAVLIGSNQHQVFGLFTGKAVLDDGTVIELNEFLGFAEKVSNKW